MIRICQRMMILTNNLVSTIKEAHNTRKLISDEIKLTPRMVIEYLIKQKNVCVKTYKQGAQALGVSPLIIGMYTQSSDAATLYLPKTNDLYILYDSEIKTKERKLWSLCHEAGHIIRGHHLQKMSDPKLVKSPILELEANTFARELLAPATLVYGFISRYKTEGPNIEDFYFAYRYVFGLSKSAAALSANILSHEGRQIKNDLSLIQQYGVKLNNLFPYISTQRDYHYLVSAMCKTEYDHVKRAYDLNKPFREGLFSRSVF